MEKRQRKRFAATELPADIPPNKSKKQRPAQSGKNTNSDDNGRTQTKRKKMQAQGKDSKSDATASAQQSEKKHQPESLASQQAILSLFENVCDSTLARSDFSARLQRIKQCFYNRNWSNGIDFVRFSIMSFSMFHVCVVQCLSQRKTCLCT